MGPEYGIFTCQAILGPNTAYGIRITNINYCCIIVGYLNPNCSNFRIISNISIISRYKQINLTPF